MGYFERRDLEPRDLRENQIPPPSEPIQWGREIGVPILVSVVSTLLVHALLNQE